MFVAFPENLNFTKKYVDDRSSYNCLINKFKKFQIINGHAIYILWPKQFSQKFPKKSLCYSTVSTLPDMNENLNITQLFCLLCTYFLRPPLASCICIFCSRKCLRLLFFLFFWHFLFTHVFFCVFTIKADNFPTDFTTTNNYLRQNPLKKLIDYTAEEKMSQMNSFLTQ